MKYIFAICISFLFISCTVRGPAPIYNIKTDSETFNGVGQSTSYSLFNFFKWGDASLTDALREGSIVKVHHIDYESSDFIGIFQSYSTLVYGQKADSHGTEDDNRRVIDSMINKENTSEISYDENRKALPDSLADTFRSKFRNKEGQLKIYWNKIVFLSNFDTVVIQPDNIKNIKPCSTELCFSIILTFNGVDESIGKAYDLIKKILKRQER